MQAEITNIRTKTETNQHLETILKESSILKPENKIELVDLGFETEHMLYEYDKEGRPHISTEGRSLAQHIVENEDVKILKYMLEVEHSPLNPQERTELLFAYVDKVYDKINHTKYRPLDDVAKLAVARSIRARYYLQPEAVKRGQEAVANTIKPKTLSQAKSEAPEVREIIADYRGDAKVVIEKIREIQKQNPESPLARGFTARLDKMKSKINGAVAALAFGAFTVLGAFGIGSVQQPREIKQEAIVEVLDESEESQRMLKQQQALDTLENVSKADESQSKDVESPAQESESTNIEVRTAANPYRLLFLGDSHLDETRHANDPSNLDPTPLVRLIKDGLRTDSIDITMSGHTAITSQEMAEDILNQRWRDGEQFDINLTDIANSPEMVYIQLGTNDMTRMQTFDGVPTNYETIINALKTVNPDVQITLMAPPPVNPNLANIPGLNDQRRTEYIAVLQSIAQTNPNVQFIDPYVGTTITSIGDGIHMTADDADNAADAILNDFKNKLTQLNIEIEINAPQAETENTDWTVEQVQSSFNGRIIETSVDNFKIFTAPSYTTTERVMSENPGQYSAVFNMHYFTSSNDAVGLITNNEGKVQLNADAGHMNSDQHGLFIGTNGEVRRIRLVNVNHNLQFANPEDAKILGQEGVAFTGTPALIVRGVRQVIPHFDSSMYGDLYYNGAVARTVIAYNEYTGKIAMVYVDGQSLEEVAKLLQSLGYTDAYTLDSGPSSGASVANGASGDMTTFTELGYQRSVPVVGIFGTGGGIREIIVNEPQ